MMQMPAKWENELITIQGTYHVTMADVLWFQEGAMWCWRKKQRILRATFVKEQFATVCAAMTPRSLKSKFNELVYKFFLNHLVLYRCHLCEKYEAAASPFVLWICKSCQKFVHIWKGCWEIYHTWYISYCKRPLEPHYMFIWEELVLTGNVCM